MIRQNNDIEKSLDKKKKRGKKEMEKYSYWKLLVT